jgi:hypothetical protein
MSKTNSIIFILVFLIIGVVAGYLLGIQQKSPENLTGSPAGNVITLKNSKMIRHWSALILGQVKEKEILGGILTIAYQDDTLQVKVEENTSIFIATSDKNNPGGFDFKEAEFKDIRIGAQVDITAEFKDNEFRAININIFSDLGRGK